MLILTRRIGETLCIGDDIEVTVLSINGHQVRVGIDAPREVPVVRKEIEGKYDNKGNRVNETQNR